MTNQRIVSEYHSSISGVGRQSIRTRWLLQRFKSAGVPSHRKVRDEYELCENQIATATEV